MGGPCILQCPFFFYMKRTACFCDAVSVSFAFCDPWLQGGPCNCDLTNLCAVGFVAKRQQACDNCWELELFPSFESAAVPLYRCWFIGFGDQWWLCTTITVASYVLARCQKK